MGYLCIRKQSRNGNELKGMFTQLNANSGACKVGCACSLTTERSLTKTAPLWMQGNLFIYNAGREGNGWSVQRTGDR